MRRILFVDDEPHLLEGLQRLLRGMRAQWEMTFAPNGEAALEILRKGPFDVVVSDMRMPRMDGAALLSVVKEEFPHIVRLVLSGQTDLADAGRVVSVAHQFLTKPCEPGVLADAVRRACDLRQILEDRNLQALIGRMDRLPSVPRVYAELTRVLADPEVSLTTVAAIIEQDIAMAAKILQLVNSAFFGLSRRVSDIHTAVSCLGTVTLRNLALSLEVFQTFGGETAEGHLSLDALQRHGLACGAIARLLLKNRRQAEDAFMAGLLHDVGRLVLASQAPKVLVCGSSDGEEGPHEGDEPPSVHYAHVGAYLLGLWGLPNSIVEAVAFHHTPSQVASRQFDVLGAVHVANALAHELSHSGEELGRESESLDLEYLERVGVAGQLEGWRVLAAEQLGVDPG